jgi:sec-independent protein translocase protein TatB
MFDLGWSELLIIGVAALIVVGPKDLPRMLRTLGQYAGRARSIAREFQRSMDEAARQADIAELHEVKKGLDDMRAAQHKMQRDMTVSLTESAGKAKAKPAAKKSAEAPPAPAAAAEAPAAKPTEPAPGPKPEPDNVSGA